MPAISYAGCGRRRYTLAEGNVSNIAKVSAPVRPAIDDTRRCLSYVGLGTYVSARLGGVSVMLRYADRGALGLLEIGGVDLGDLEET